MHESNVILAWTASVADALQEVDRNTGLDARAHAALTLIASHPGCSAEWLRPRVELTQSGTVRLIDRLEQARFVDRRRNGRGVELRVSRRGAAELKRVQVERAAALEEVLSGLGAGERGSLVSTLAKALRDRPRERGVADRTCRTCEWPACGESCPVEQSVRAG